MTILISLWSEQVNSDELFDAIIRCIFNADEEEEETPLDPRDAQPIVKGLIAAYLGCLKREGVEDPKVTEDAAESEKMYRKNYFRAFPEAKGGDGMGWYPECLPYEKGIPHKVLWYAGQGIGRKEKLQQKAWFEYYASYRTGWRRGEPVLTNRLTRS
jgi:hypothetical protein